MQFPQEDGNYDGATTTPQRKGSLWYPGSHVFIAAKYKRESIQHLRFADQVPILSMTKKHDKFFRDLECGYLTNPQFSKQAMDKQEIVKIAGSLRLHYRLRL
jgi:hypothetical protein